MARGETSSDVRKAHAESTAAAASRGHSVSVAETAGASEGRGASAADGSTFAPALALLGSPLRTDIESLYLVLRRLDDLVDEHDACALARVQAVERWARGGQAESAEAQALAALAARHPQMRSDALLEFCAGMRHDIASAGIESEQAFTRYCQQAGGSVGEVLGSLLGSQKDDADGRRETQQAMATLGRAMQVTNILRDIDEDHAAGRIYIPTSLIERYGFPAPGAREGLLRELIARADALYEEGRWAIGLLRHGRAAMSLAAALYQEILRQIERDGYGAQPGRASVPAARTRALIAAHRAAASETGLESKSTE